MCWSGEASLVMTGVGLTGALWSKKQKMPPGIWVSLLWFTTMEFIQAMTYRVIGQCGDPLNTTLTYFGYMHIALQGYFVQWIALTFSTDEVKKKWFIPAMISSTVTALWYTAMAFYTPIMGTLCRYSWFCADQTCSIHGNWHIAWQLRLSNLEEIGAPMYWINAFIFPLFYRSWRWPLFHLIVGPIAARLTTDNRFEIAAVWCLFSIGFLTAMKIKPVWNWLMTDRIKAGQELSR